MDESRRHAGVIAWARPADVWPFCAVARVAESVETLCRGRWQPSVTDEIRWFAPSPGQRCGACWKAAEAADRDHKPDNVHRGRSIFGPSAESGEQFRERLREEAIARGPLGNVLDEFIAILAEPEEPAHDDTPPDDFASLEVVLGPCSPDGIDDADEAPFTGESIGDALERTFGAIVVDDGGAAGSGEMGGGVP